MLEKTHLRYSGQKHLYIINNRWVFCLKLHVPYLLQLKSKVGLALSRKSKTPQTSCFLTTQIE